MTERELTKCPTCKTRTLHREGEELVCSECKGRFPAPSKNLDAVALGKLGGQKGGKARFAKLSKEQKSELGKRAVNTRWNRKRPMNQKGPKDTTRKDNMVRHRYYEQNKEAIVKDMLEIGRKRTREKWGIPQPTIVYLEARWLTDQQRAQVTDAGIPIGDGCLPMLPFFSNDWEPEVQVKWLEIYGKLYVKDSK